MWTPQRAFHVVLLYQIEISLLQLVTWISQDMYAFVVVVYVLQLTLTQGLFLGAPLGARRTKQIKQIAVTGSTGLLGKALCERLLDRGIAVKSVSTRDGGELPIDVFKGCEMVVHLAGENIASGSLESPFALLGAWTEKKKIAIMSSRVEGTRAVVNAINNMPRGTGPSVLVCASAVGLYGYNDNDGQVFTESGLQGGGFLAEVVAAWEGEAAKLRKGVRLVNTRFGVVLSTKGGVLAKLRPIFNLAAGGNLGDGTQGFSFVSIDDAVRAIEFAIDNSKVTGPVNVCSPEPVTNAEFTQALGKALGRPAIFPVPQLVGSLVFGEFGNEVLFGGQNVVPKKLTDLGFKFDDIFIDSTVNRLING